MNTAISPVTSRPYGVKRVCAAWDVPRSSFYHHRQQERPPALSRGRRGPKPAISDERLLAAIRADLARSPLTGEGHRKVWGRLRILDRIRVSRKRVLRLLREHGLLSPYRHRPAEPSAHEGAITTHAPHVLWGTDGARAVTLEDGWVWIFSAVEHWNGECVGIHVAKKGDRFAALEPLAQGLTRLYGAVTAEVARGLSLRMDHGTQSLADDFQHQLQYWGITRELRLRRTAPDPRGGGALQPDLERTNPPRPNLPERRRTPHGRHRLRPHLPHPVAPRETRLPDARRGAPTIRPTRGRIRQPCVQGTGSGTPRESSGLPQRGDRRSALLGATAQSEPPAGTGPN